MPNNPNNFKANPGDRNEGKAKLAFPETAELGLGLEIRRSDYNTNGGKNIYQMLANIRL